MSLLHERDLDELLRSAESTRLPDAALWEGNVMEECRLVYQSFYQTRRVCAWGRERTETVDVEDGRGIG